MSEVIAISTGINISVRPLVDDEGNLVGIMLEGDGLKKVVRGYSTIHEKAVALGFRDLSV